jgi:hypothetical protein
MTILEKQIRTYLKNEGLSYSVKTIRWVIYTIEMGKGSSLGLDVKLVENIKRIL